MSTNEPNRRPTADVEQFTDHYGEHLLGDREEVRAIGPFIVEHYIRAGFWKVRKKNGFPKQAVIQVYERDPDSPSGYDKRFHAFIGDHGAAEMMRRVDSPETVAKWIDHYGNGDSLLAIDGRNYNE
jgi:hypothetical protein